MRSPARASGIRLRCRPRTLVLASLAAAVALAAAVWIGVRLDWPAIQQALERLNPALLVTAMALLPLAGFSIAAVYLVAGARFGPVVGGAVVAGVTLVHLVLTHVIARSLLRGWIERMMARRGHRLPDLERGQRGAEAAVVAIGALVPGLPYFVRNYLLGLSGARLRVITGVCLPIYVARAYLVILLGDLTGDWSLRGFAVIAAVFVVKLAICALLLRWLQKRYGRRAQASPAAARAIRGDDSKHAASTVGSSARVTDGAR